MEPSYVSGRADRPLLGRTIGDQLRRSASAHPDVEALVAPHQDIRLTFAQLEEASEEVARALLALGVARGDRVGIWSANRAEWTLVQYATALIGAILVNVNPAYRTHELEFVLRRSGIGVRVAARNFRSTDYVAMLDRVRSRAPSLGRIVLLGAEESWASSWGAFLSGAGKVPREAVAERGSEPDVDDPINIQYTSGTTGLPKGATLSHHNILNNGFFVGERLGLVPGDRICVPVPFYHCFGMVMGTLAALTHGTTVVLPGEAFHPHAVLQAVERERCTALYGVPTMFVSELGSPGFDRFDLSSLRTGIMAGAPCPVEVMKQEVDRMHMHEVTICYGMTETSPVSFQSLPHDDLDRRVSTVGRSIRTSRPRSSTRSPGPPSPGGRRASCARAGTR